MTERRKSARLARRASTAPYNSSGTGLTSRLGNVELTWDSTEDDHARSSTGCLENMLQQQQQESAEMRQLEDEVLAGLDPAEARSNPAADTTEASDAPSDLRRRGGVSKGSLASQVLSAINHVRAHPSAVAAALQRRCEYYDGQDYMGPELCDVIIETQEGRAAVEEAIEALERQDELPQLSFESGAGMRLAAQDHADDLGAFPGGGRGHKGTDGSSASDRLRRYGQWKKAYSELIWYGKEGFDASHIVQDLLIDDGVASRTHRRALLDPRMRLLGVAHGPHEAFGRCVVLSLAAAYTDNPDGQAARTLHLHSVAEQAAAQKSGPGRRRAVTQLQHCDEDE